MILGSKREWISVDIGLATVGPNGGTICRSERCAGGQPPFVWMKACDGYIVVERFDGGARHSLSFGVTELVHLVHPCFDFREVEAHLPVIRSRLDNLIHLLNVQHLRLDWEHDEVREKIEALRKEVPSWGHTEATPPPPEKPALCPEPTDPPKARFKKPLPTRRQRGILRDKRAKLPGEVRKRLSRRSHQE